MDFEIKPGFSSYLITHLPPHLPQEANVGDYIPQRTIPLAEAHHLPGRLSFLVLVQCNQQLHHFLTRWLAIVLGLFVAKTGNKMRSRLIKEFKNICRSFRSLSVISALEWVSPVIPSRSLVLLQFHLSLLIYLVLYHIHRVLVIRNFIRVFFRLIWM